MPRLKSITIENFRSIGESLVNLKFPVGAPVILIGENNSGKTNLIRAVELMFGEFHPKYKKLDDFDHFNRDPQQKVVIKAEVEEFSHRLGYSGNFTCGGFTFTCQKNHENGFVAIQAEDGEENKYVSSDLREELLCVVVNSEQNLSYQLSYASKYTLLSRVTKAFHDKLIEDQDRVEELKRLFGKIKENFLEVPEFSTFVEGMSTIAGEMLSNMRHALKFDFSAYDPSNYFKTLRVQPTEDGDVRSIEELGTGQQQVLALSFAHAYAKSFLGQGLVFVVDEPEAHLHPLAQRWLANQMFKMASEGLQLIITTHSPYFINLEHLSGIHIVRKDDQTEVLNLTEPELAQFCEQNGASRARADTIGSYYAAHGSPHILNGFFAKKIILVEGPTEEQSIPIYLDAIGLDTLKNGISIIAVGGKGNLAKWWRFFGAYKIPCFVCFDNDLHDDANGSKRKDALRAIGIEEESLAEIIAEDDWTIGDKFCVFGRDFETTLRNSFADYHELEKERRSLLGDSKPIIAKSVAKELRERATQELGWDKFSELKKKLEAL